MPTVRTFAVREVDVSRHNGGPAGAPLKTLRDDSALRSYLDAVAARALHDEVVRYIVRGEVRGYPKGEGEAAGF